MFAFCISAAVTLVGQPFKHSCEMVWFVSLWSNLNNSDCCVGPELTAKMNCGVLITCGVPQGSKTGSLLLILYRYNKGSSQASRTNLNCYADDAQSFIAITINVISALITLKLISYADGQFYIVDLITVMLHWQQFNKHLYFCSYI